MTIADEIKSCVMMEEVFSAYGFTPNRAGFIPCPFHEEKTPSLSAFDGGTRWHCFGCGESGDVISFVEKLFGINFGQAIIRLNSDFGLNLPLRKPDRRSQIAVQKTVLERKNQEEERKQRMLALISTRREMWLKTVTLRPKSIEETLDPDFLSALKEIDYLDYYIETASQKEGENH